MQDSFLISIGELIDIELKLEKILINDNLKKQQELKVLEYLLKKINIMLLGAINRNNKEYLICILKKIFMAELQL